MQPRQALLRGICASSARKFRGSIKCADMEMGCSRPVLALAGHSFILIGDIASARVSYQRSDAGDGRAVLRMGATFDPAFLSRAGLGTAPGDPAEARS